MPGQSKSCLFPSDALGPPAPQLPKHRPSGIRDSVYTRLPWYTEAGRHGHVGVLRLVSEQGEDPEAMVGALCLACRHGHADAVQLLLSYGVPRDVNVKVDPYGDVWAVSPLWCACDSGNAHIAVQLLAATPPLGPGRGTGQLEHLLFRRPRSLTAAAVPVAERLLAEYAGQAEGALDEARRPLKTASDLLAHADGAETEQQLLALCRGVRNHWTSIFRWAVLQKRIDVVRQLAAPPQGADAAAVEELCQWLAEWNEGMLVAGVPPAMLEVLQGMGLKAWGGKECVVRALEAGSMEQVRVQLAAASGGAGGGGAAAAGAAVGAGAGVVTAGVDCEALAAAVGTALSHGELLSRVVKEGVDLEAKLPMLLDILASSEPAWKGGEEPQQGRDKAPASPGCAFSPQAASQVAGALEAAAERRDSGAVLGLLLRDGRVRAIAHREESRGRMLEAVCRCGDAVALRLLLRELLGLGLAGAGAEGGAAGAQAQGGWLAAMQGLLPLAAAHHSGDVLRELLSAGLRPGADAAAVQKAARAACKAGSVECLRLVAAACGPQQVASWDGGSLLRVVLWDRYDSEGAPAPAMPVVVALAEVLRDAFARTGQEAGFGQGERRSVPDEGAGSAASTPDGGGVDGSSNIDSGGGSCGGPAPVPTRSGAAPAGWHLPLLPQQVYQRAVDGGHWDVAAWALKHLPSPPSESSPFGHTDTARDPHAAPKRAGSPEPADSAPNAASPALSLQHAVASGHIDQVRRLLDQPAVFSKACGKELLGLASYHGHVLVLRALLMRLGAHLLLRSCDMWAVVEGAALGGCAAAAREVVGMLPLHGLWMRGITAQAARLRALALAAGHIAVAEVFAAAEV